MAPRLLGAAASALNHGVTKGETDDTGGTWWQTYGTVDTGVNQMVIPMVLPFALRITRIVYWNATAGSGGTHTAALRLTAGGSDISGSSGTPAVGGGTALTGLALDFAARATVFIVCTATNSTTKPVGLAMSWEGIIL